MLRRFSSLFFFVAVSLAPFLRSIPAGAQEQQQQQQSKSLKASSDFKQRVSRLIDDLDSDLFKVRSRAEKELMRLGPRVLPLLPPPELTPDASVREAVRRIRVGLERIKARRSVEPSRATLTDRLPLEHILAEIQKQTGNAIDASRLPAETRSRRLQADWRREPFWKALDDLAQHGGFRYDFDRGGAGLVLIQRVDEPDSPRKSVSYSGAFRILAKPASLRPLLGDEEHRLLRIHVAVQAEPRLRPLFLKVRAVNFTAAADGHAFPPFTPESSQELPLGTGGGSASFQIDFTVPRDVTPEQVSLRGSVMLTTAAGEEQIAFDRPASSARVARRRGGVTVMLERAEFQPADDGTRDARVRVAVGYDAGGPAFESHRAWMFHNRTWLETPHGDRVAPEPGSRTALQADGVVAVHYRFTGLKKKPDEYRFVYTAPTLILDVPVEFELKAVPVSVKN